MALLLLVTYKFFYYSTLVNLAVSSFLSALVFHSPNPTSMAEGQQTLSHNSSLRALPPMHDPSKEIRLLQVEPAEFNDKICCTMLAGLLDKAPEFTAISYTWGPEFPQQ